MEGKGMLSWNLAEKREGTTWVCGRVAKRISWDDEEDEGRDRKRRKIESGEDQEELEEENGEEEDVEEDEADTLEVWLQLVEVCPPFLLASLFLQNSRRTDALLPLSTATIIITKSVLILAPVVRQS